MFTIYNNLMVRASIDCDEAASSIATTPVFSVAIFQLYFYIDVQPTYELCIINSSQQLLILRVPHCVTTRHLLTIQAHITDGHAWKCSSC